jgi:hypothetical protein
MRKRVRKWFTPEFKAEVIDAAQQVGKRGRGFPIWISPRGATVAGSRGQVCASAFAPAAGASAAFGASRPRRSRSTPPRKN